MAAERGRRDGLELALEVVTAEASPLAAFGAEASAEIARRLAAAGIGVRAGTHAAEFADGRLRLEPEGSLAADLVVALPHLRGPRVPGIAHDGGGFVSVDPYCRVRGTERIWAVGDMTTRPLKQGGLAAQQADVAAAGIAALAGADITVEAVPPAAARAPVHRPRAGVPRAPPARAARLGGVRGLPLVAAAEGGRALLRALPRVARRRPGHGRRLSLADRLDRRAGGAQRGGLRDRRAVGQHH